MLANKFRTKYGADQEQGEVRSKGRGKQGIADERRGRSRGRVEQRQSWGGKQENAGKQ